MQWCLTRGRFQSAAFVAVTVAALADVGLRAQYADRIDAPGSSGADRAVRLVPTVHPAVPSRQTDFWYVPDSFPPTGSGRVESSAEKFARAVRVIDSGDFAAALPLVTAADLSATPLAVYGSYYRAIALAGLNRIAEADDLLAQVEASAAGQRGYLFDEAIPLKRAEFDVARQNARHAVDALEKLTNEKFLTSPEDVWLRLGRAAEAAGDRAKAIDAYRKVYYESPLSLQALDAQNLLARIDDATLTDKFKLELARAERIFNARRWAQSRAGFAPLASLASGDDKELIALRLAECDYYLDRFRASRDALTPFLESASRKAEARFFYLIATRALGDTTAYEHEARALVDEFPDSSWALETLNNLASYYVIADDDAAADEVFRQLVRSFPQSRYAERAFWKIGWWAYRNGRFADAAEAFDTASASFRRADTRPAWLYWSGRAHDQLGETATANDRYRVEVADYENSYYGRLAAKMLETRAVAVVDNVTVAVTPSTPAIPTASVIRQLVALELYDAALKELQFAQRAWGNSPTIEATTAWIRHEQAQKETAPERFDHLRGAINAMKRAYPQYLAAGGEQLPAAVLAVIYPLDYWPLIDKYSKENGLDPYLMSALIAQESTFTADVRSSANAYGLMQLLPSTGRRYAQRIGMRPFSTASLTRPEANIRLGMAYFKDLVDRFGGAHFALASYNAGESRVSQWRDERPGLQQDEFIDDIPYPETQNYVKRILGTAEDYRRLYGEGRLVPGSLKDAPPTRPLRVTAKAKSPRKAPVQRVSRKKKITR